MSFPSTQKRAEMRFRIDKGLAYAKLKMPIRMTNLPNSHIS